MAEWSIASDLKSDEAKTSGSSNLPLSVKAHPPTFRSVGASTSQYLRFQYIKTKKRRQLLVKLNQLKERKSKAKMKNKPK
ncbi:hypothetical protein CRC_00938 [Cylindrospermopsis raciborskii CS-505]|nr:hypothetical protein CRC_00938 [Cylindrospermopsis raciborskii CS-505]